MNRIGSGDGTRRKLIMRLKMIHGMILKIKILISRILIFLFYEADNRIRTDDLRITSTLKVLRYYRQ